MRQARGLRVVVERVGRSERIGSGFADDIVMDYFGRVRAAENFSG